jgi:carbon-monoxide dehydrogenase large subunit
MKFGLGQSALREEDNRFLRGQGRYTDDINLPNQAHSYILRSPYAHALIRAIDMSAARGAPGVLALDLRAEKSGGVYSFLHKNGMPYE